MTTLAQLRALLEMAPDGPARQRAGGTVEGMARACLPRFLCFDEPRYHPALRAADMLTEEEVRVGGHVGLDLTDPGTARALLTALALALGLDPGVGALEVRWRRIPMVGAHRFFDGYQIDHAGELPFLFVRSQEGSGSRDWRVTAPTVANEPDPIKALGLAVAHVLANP